LGTIATLEIYNKMLTEMAINLPHEYKNTFIIGMCLIVFLLWIPFVVTELLGVTGFSKGSEKSLICHFGENTQLEVGASRGKRKRA
jgi:hypothetical protein